MRRFKFFVIIFLLTLVAFFSVSNPLSAQEVIDDGTHDRVIIKFKPYIPGFFRAKYAQRYGFLLNEQLRLRDTFVIEIPRASSVDLTDRFSRSFLVEYAEIDGQAESFLIPNDSLYSDQWGLNKIEAPDAWDVTTGSSSVDIAIIDSGVNSVHPDLNLNIIESVDCRYSSCPGSTTSDPYGHGTHIAGIAAATFNNSIGISGVSPQSKIMSVKVLDDSGSGYYSWIANGIVWATDNGAEVINLSLGGRFRSYTLENAINYAWENGVVVVAAAGNYSSNYPVYPAYFSNTIAVAAVDENDNKASTSNYGTWVDLAAPGTNIISTYRSDYEYLSGTSMASPFVAGVSALLLSEHPDWSNSQIRAKLESSADEISGTGQYWKFGRLNACASLDCTTLSPTQTPTSTPTVIPTATSTPLPTLTSTPTNIPTITTTPTPTPTVIPTATPTDSVTPTPTPLPTQTPTPTVIPTTNPTPTVIPTPTPSTTPWWCSYVPDHWTCQ